jgi:methylated-DNA-protein-cysteine methyltransferase-like protein
VLDNNHMPFNQKTFDQAIEVVVSGIRPGHVMSYGEVARAAGFPRHARMVSKAIGRCAKPLPWHRVVKSDRTLAFEPGSEPYNKQKALLAKEGVQLTNGKVVPRGPADAVDLDKLIWGPPGV